MIFDHFSTIFDYFRHLGKYVFCFLAPTSLLSPHDLPVDIIATPTQVIYCPSNPNDPIINKPSQGVLWQYVDEKLCSEICALHDLRELSEHDLKIIKGRHGYVRKARGANRPESVLLSASPYRAIVDQAVDRFSDERVLASVNESSGRGRRRKKHKKGGNDQSGSASKETSE